MILIKKGLSLLPSLIPLYELQKRFIHSNGYSAKIYWHMLTQRFRDKDNQYDYLTYSNNQLIASLHIYLFIDSVQISIIVISQVSATNIINKMLLKALNQIPPEEAKKCILICNNKDKSLNNRYTLWGGQLKFTVKELQAPHMLPEFQKTLSLSIENATIEDIEIILQISTTCFNNPFHDQLRLKYLNDLKNNQRHIYIARNAENEIIGKLHVREDEKQIVIHEVGILPKYQKHGYGQCLMLQWLQQNASRYDDKPIIVEVLNDSDAAMGLYRSCGFIENDSFNYYEFDVPYLRAQINSV